MEQINMENEVLISIIVPVYNTEKYLENCIKTLVAQTVEEMEIILVDDGSKDNSLEICRKYEAIDKRVRVIHQENAGANAARKRGLTEARGIYVGFVDSDDWVESEMFEKLLLHSQNCEADIVAGGLIIHWPTGDQISCDTIKPGVYEGEKLDEVYMRMLCNEWYYEFGILPNLCGKLMRKEILSKIFYDIDEKITYGEDAAVVYPFCLLSEKIVSVQEAYYHYNINDASATFNTDHRQFDSLYRLYQHLNRWFKDEKLSHLLDKQLKFYVTMLGLRAFKEVYEVDFTSLADYWMPDYLMHFERMKGKKVVLYGAGTVGQNFHEQMKKKQFLPVVWVDNNWQMHEGSGRGVRAPQEILGMEYDLVLIAVKSEETAEQIKAQLMELGIEKKKIVWYKTRGVCMIESLIGW